jgi:ATP-dependent RNA helicase RhlE
MRDFFHVTTFADLGLAEPLLKALAAEGYETPTPIQTKAIPIVKSGADLLGIAQTGTGKTAAFALPILHRLASDRRPAAHKGCRVLVLSPTRELATQIAESFRTYGRFLDLKVAVVFGGVAHKPQQIALSRGVDVLVATPGRLLDHVGERNVVLSGSEIFVLDEADQMLDLGFMKPIRRIVSMLAHKRQNLFFSATMPHEIGALAAELLVNPQRVEIAPAATTVERVDQRVVLVEQSMKRALLVELFADPALSRTLVFTRTKRGADKVTQHLEGAGISAAAIHGNKSQAQRERALESFRQSKTRVLVATDIAARGIDIDLVSHVVNFELPEVPEQYVHRIGRTGRAGASGIAISLCDHEERGLLRDIERVTRQQIPHEDRRNDPTLVATATASPRQSRDGDGRRGGNRDQRGERAGRPRVARSNEGRTGERSGERTHERSGGLRSGGPRHAQNGADRGRDRDNGPRRERGEYRDGGLISAGGWSPMFDEPVMMAPRRDERRQGDGQRTAEHHRGERRGEHRPDHRAGHRNEPRRHGDGRGEARGEHRGEARGEHRGGARGEHRGGARGEKGHGRADHRPDHPRGGQRPAHAGAGRPQQGQRRSDGGRGRGFKAGA